jgi:hypothetical protein
LPSPVADASPATTSASLAGSSDSSRRNAHGATPVSRTDLGGRSSGETLASTSAATSMISTGVR